MFDYKNALKELGLTQDEEEKLLNEIREEFPDDEMLFELHVIRAVNSLKKVKLEKSVRMNG